MSGPHISVKITRLLQENAGKPMTRTQIVEKLGLPYDNVRHSLNYMVQCHKIMSKTIEGERNGDMAVYCLYSDAAAREAVSGRKVTPRAERPSVFDLPAWVPPAVPYRRPTYDAPNCIIREHLTKERLA